MVVPPRAPSPHPLVRARNHRSRGPAVKGLCLTLLGFLLIPAVSVAQLDTRLEEHDPTWLWSLRLARLASKPGGTAVAEPGLLEFGYSKPLQGDVWRRDLDDGWSLGSGLGVRLETGYRRPLGPNLVVRARFRASSHAGVADRVRLLEGGIWGVTGPVAWAVGRQRFWWSPTPETSLLLSNNAPPLDAVSIRSSKPWTLPYGLGSISWETMLAYLDDPYRVVPYPLVWGGQFFYQPFPSFRLEVRRTAMFGGAGRTQRLTPGDVLDILLGRGENLLPSERGPDDADQYLSYAVRWRWPLPNNIRLWAYGLGLRDLEIFGEYGGTDALRRGFPMSVARQMGARLRFHSWEVTGLYVETVATNTWYEHIVFRSGYRYRGRLLAHPGGGDNRWVRIRVGKPWLDMTGLDFETTLERGNVLEAPPVWETSTWTVRWWRVFLPGLRGLVTGTAGFEHADGDATPDRFPAFSLRIALIFGNALPFNEFE